MSTEIAIGNTPENREKARERFSALVGQIPSNRAGAVKDRLAEMPVSCRRSYLSALMARGGAKRAIKAFCLECVCWDRDEVRNCTAVACPLYAYRSYK